MPYSEFGSWEMLSLLLLLYYYFL